MKTISLMYHDVVEPGKREASGFPQADAALYKLDRAAFAEHLHAISRSACRKPTSVVDFLAKGGAEASPPLFLTFDDGGVSAYTHIADLLETYGWRGHFFVTTSYINSAGFLSPQQIQELHQRGHVVGSHSHSHPPRMANCTRTQIIEEWRVSTDILSNIMGENVVTASVPGGYHAKRVAEAASQVGLKALFTSEPVARNNKVGDCLILGRYTIQRRTPPAAAAALASGKLTPRLKQQLIWDGKKMVKLIAGGYYIKMRRALLKNQ